jgi:hypothetical protein
MVATFTASSPFNPLPLLLTTRCVNSAGHSRLRTLLPLGV